MKLNLLNIAFLRIKNVQDLFQADYSLILCSINGNCMLFSVFYLHTLQPQKKCLG